MLFISFLIDLRTSARSPVVDDLKFGMERKRVVRLGTGWACGCARTDTQCAKRRPNIVEQHERFFFSETFEPSSFDLHFLSSSFSFSFISTLIFPLVNAVRLWPLFSLANFSLLFFSSSEPGKVGQDVRRDATAGDQLELAGLAIANSCIYNLRQT